VPQGTAFFVGEALIRPAGHLLPASGEKEAVVIALPAIEGKRCGNVPSPRLRGEGGRQAG
jgi:hypothetical protein